MNFGDQIALKSGHAQKALAHSGVGGPSASMSSESFLKKVEPAACGVRICGWTRSPVKWQRWSRPASQFCRHRMLLAAEAHPGARARARPCGRRDRYPHPTNAGPRGQMRVGSLCLSFSICDLGTRGPPGRCEDELKPSKALTREVVSALEMLGPGDFFFEWRVVGQAPNLSGCTPRE